MPAECIACNVTVSRVVCDTQLTGCLGGSGTDSDDDHSRRSDDLFVDDRNTLAASFAPLKPLDFGLHDQAHRPTQLGRCFGLMHLTLLRPDAHHDAQHRQVSPQRG